MNSLLLPALLVAACVFSLPLSKQSHADPTGSTKGNGNVILITIDGTRYQEIFQGNLRKESGLPKFTELLPKLKARVKAKKAFAFDKMQLGNIIGLSLPGYRSILSGEFEARCTENDCPNTDRVTIYDDLAHQGFTKDELAAFSSWDVTERALESTPGKITKCIGFDRYTEAGLSAGEEAFLESIHEQMQADLPPWIGSPYGKYTFELIKFYLERHDPRLFYAMFVETDEYGHLKDYRGYVRAIQDFDNRLDELMSLLDKKGEWGENTSIVITTDHGRGRGKKWFPNHSREYLSADHVWAFVIPSQRLLREHRLEASKKILKTHLDIRPTMELLMGLKPKRSPNNLGTPLISIR